MKKARSEMNEVRAGVIGIGNMGSAHAAQIYDGKVENLRLCAVCELDENKLRWAEKRLPGVSCTVIIGK